MVEPDACGSALVGKRPKFDGFEGRFWALFDGPRQYNHWRPLFDATTMGPPRALGHVEHDDGTQLTAGAHAGCIREVLDRLTAMLCDKTPCTVDSGHPGPGCTWDPGMT